MNIFDENLAREVAEQIAMKDNEDEKSLINSFVEVCRFLGENPKSLSWRNKNNKPSVFNQSGLVKLAEKYFQGYRKLDLPAKPSTIPDAMVSVIMREFHGYSDEDCQRIQKEHQESMCAENCVGNLLERYLDSVLRSHNWYWCCGDFVKARDFLSKNSQGQWIALQIKNRDNSENSSSSAIRGGTQIQKWFRSFSKDTKKGRSSLTNWGNLPISMQGYNLSEEGFKRFVIQYLRKSHFKNFPIKFWLLLIKINCIVGFLFILKSIIPFAYFLIVGSLEEH